MMMWQMWEMAGLEVRRSNSLRHLRSSMGNTKAGKCDEFINHRYLLLLCLSFFQILQKAFFKQAPAGNLFKDHREDYFDAPAGNFFKDHRRDYSKGVPAASASRAFCKTVSNAIAALLYSSSFNIGKHGSTLCSAGEGIQINFTVMILALFARGRSAI